MNRVLVIEDDAVARRQLVQLFRFENFEVSEAESGQTGIAVAKITPPDLVVCDIMMPGMDGFGVLEALRKNPETCLTPFIFLTAKAGGHDVRLGMSSGADDYITKPFDPEALLASARQRLARRQLQIDEAERRAADTGMLAAAALPREMEGCLAHIDTMAELLAAKYSSDRQVVEMRRAMKDEVARLRALSQRLRLYGELPSLYARRFSMSEDTDPGCSHEIAVDAARATASHWNRIDDLQISALEKPVPLTATSLIVMASELVDNACKFSAPVTPVVVEAGPEQGYWKLTVTDHGQGMLSEHVENIGAFKQFWQGSERPRGLGLGLTLVQTLARLHSGEVLIESEPRNGTRVTVMVPSE